MHALWRRGARPGALGIHVRQADAGQAGHAAGTRRLVAGVWHPGAGLVDSRWLGPVPQDLIAGRVLARYPPASCRD